MSLFGSLQTASNTLRAVQIGLQVVNNNIANAGTEGYIREQANFAPTPVQKLGSLQIGTGVKVDSITQKVDEFLGTQLRDAAADRVSADLQNQAYKDLEELLGELTGGDLSTSLTGFFGSIEDTLNAVGGDAASIRNLAVLEGRRLSQEIQRVEDAAQDLRDGYDQQIAQAADQVNALTEQIRRLNIQISQTEGGGAGKSDAGALRATRNQAINELTELVSATVREQPSGGVSISVNGEFLVFEGQRRLVAVVQTEDQSEPSSSLRFTDTGKALKPTAGRVHGLTAARDQIVDGFRDSLNDFAATLIYEFNRVHSQGQGIEGFGSLTSQDAVDDPAAALDAAGLAFAPENGSFRVSLLDEASGDFKTAVIDVRLQDDAAGEKSSLQSVADQIDAVAGLTATVTSTGRLAIATESPNAVFTFSNDTSGLLASLGLNTFFVGSNADNIGTNPELDGVKNAGKLALRRAPDGERPGPGGTTENAVLLAGLIDAPLGSLDGASISESYDQVVNELAQNSTVAGSVAEGLGVFEATLANEWQAISGVNIDEEAIDLISLQRIFQATGRVIQTIQSMLETLVNL
ncbi:flagellar hook-associated protein FlgK [Botrimarina sp.]|uniref:flagellar hook-associated protein FlgK n=1 Tax=Botrimarina sp. TaxID=2795802 RepID=UPI0032EAB05D